MSAPHAKHGAPTHDEIINIADQHKAMIISRAFTGDMYPVSCKSVGTVPIAECGIYESI